METNESYWKDLYFKTYSENRQLKMKLEDLQQAYTTLKRKYKSLKKPPTSKPPTDPKLIRISHSVDLTRAEMLAQSIVAPCYDIEKLPESSLKNSLRLTQNRSLKGSQKLTQMPESDFFIYEELFILTASPSLNGCSTVGRYPNSFDIPAYSVLPEFCFPAGIHARQFQVTESNSLLNQLLYGQNFGSRNENHFVFALKPQEIVSSKAFDMLDTLYCCCVVIEDLTTYQGAEWIIPKCYCLISYLPHFALHFEFLKKLLFMTRIRRMQEIGGLTASVGKFSTPDFTDCEMALLEDYRVSREPCSGEVFILEVPDQDPLAIDFNSFSLVESEWLCGPLFSILRFEDLFWLWEAVLLERSIVVVSCNLALLSSIVLGLRHLIKPLIWPHVVLPIIPDSLRELLEAPVPFLIGLPAPAPALRKTYENVIWVMVDEPSERRRVQTSSKIKEEVKEIWANGLRDKVKYAYAAFEKNGICYSCNQEQVMVIKNVTRIFREFVEFLISFLPKVEDGELIDSQKLVKSILPKFSQADHLFLKVFLSTQLVMTNLR